MAEKLLATTWNASEAEARIYVSNSLSSPAGLLEKDLGSVRWKGSAIHSAGQHMIAAGDDAILHSADGGTTWTAPTIAPSLPGEDFRKVQYGSANNAFYMNRKAVYRSTDNGATWAAITPVISNVRFMDIHMSNDTTGFMVYSQSTPFSGGAIVMKTTNAGTAWTFAFTMQTSPDWTVGEAPRRIWCSSDQLLVYMLTSVAFWKIEYLSGSWVMSRLWNHLQDIAATYGFIAPNVSNGWNPGFTLDTVKTFDQLEVSEGSPGRIWLGGYYGLRAHSFDELTYLFTDPTSIESSGLANLRMHEMYSASGGFVGSSKLSPYVSPNQQGIWKTVNGAVSTSMFTVFDPKESLQSISAFRGSVTTGCTIPDSCNYDANAIADDGSCQQAVRLTECTTGQVIHTVSAELSSLACRMPRFGVNIQGVHSLFAGYSATININGSQVFAFNYVVDMGMTPAERLAAFISELIFQINSTTTLTATPIQPSQNPFVPNSTTGIWVECDSISCAGQQVIFSQGGLTGVNFSPVLDNGSLGSIAVLAEYPGKCWSICGDGDCALAQTLSLIGSYPDCYRCAPFDAPTTCRDCDSMLVAGGTPAYTSPENLHKQCISLGQSLDFDINVGFPNPGSNTFLVVNPGSACSTGCPLTTSVAGNHLADFPEGSGFTVNAGTEVYTVATVSYDQIGDVTTIVSSEACQNGATFTAITSFAACVCSVRLQILDVTNDATLVDQLYPCIGGLVSQVFSYLPLIPTEIRVLITASDCASSRVCEFWFDVCDSLNLCEIDCHTYRLQARTTLPPTVEYTVSILNVVTNQIEGANLTFTGAEMNAGVEVVTPSDGLYIIRVANDADSSLERYEIIDLCDAERCRVSLVEDVFCTANDPCDPSCTECDSDRDQKRYLYNPHRNCLVVDRQVRVRSPCQMAWWMVRPHQPAGRPGRPWQFYCLFARDRCQLR
jgi:hypothetical protein